MEIADERSGDTVNSQRTTKSILEPFRWGSSSWDTPLVGISAAITITLTHTGVPQKPNGVKNTPLSLFQQAYAPTNYTHTHTPAMWLAESQLFNFHFTSLWANDC